MKITVGVRSVNEAEFFLSNGADEVYFGVRQLKNNRLPFESFSKFSEVERLLQLTKSRGKRAFLTVNDSLNPEEYGSFDRYLGKLADKGLYGVILKDPALISHVGKSGAGYYVVLSTVASCFNSAALEFFSGLGISRIVLSGQTLPENAQGLINNRFGIETEVFCHPLYYDLNVNQSCSLPCPQNGNVKSASYPDFTCLLPFRSPQGRYLMPMPPPSYMLNAFYDYYKAGVGFLKVARWPNSARQADLFLKARYLLRLLEKGVSRKLFVHAGQRIDTKPLEYGNSFNCRSFGG
jgi:hypothetical protein